jgi:hypothetical protein
LYLFLIPGTNSSNLSLGSEGGYIYCINLISSDVTVSSMVSTTHDSTTHIMKGRAHESSHPISTTICSVPNTQSKADEHKKHEKQKRDEKDQGIHEISFQVPKQNSYTPSGYCFYAVDQISKQHTCTIPINTRFLSLSFPVKPPHIEISSSRSRSVNFHKEGTSRVNSQQSVSIEKNVKLQRHVSAFKVQISVFQPGQRNRNSQQSVRHQKPNHQQPVHK